MSDGCVMQLWGFKKIYSNSLFVIHGEQKKPLLNALEWLRSSEGEGIGNDLLARARKLHEKPLWIQNGTTRSTAYFPTQHLVEVNFPELASYEELAQNGIIQKSSITLEEILAHELTHAGQQHGGMDVPEVFEKIRESLWTPAERETLYKAGQDIINAPTYYDALQAIERYVDAKIPINDRIHALGTDVIAKHPDAVAALRLEEEAVSYENRVRALKGRKPRQDYFNPGVALSWDDYRESMRQEVASKFYYDYFRKPGGPWTEFEQFPGGKGGVAEIPLVGVSDIQHRGLLARVRKNLGFGQE